LNFKTMLSVRYWDEKLYPTPETRDPVIGFLEKIGKRIRPDQVVLDIGAGAGELNAYDFKGRCKEMIGVDLDPRVSDNPLLDRGICCDANKLPLPDASVDFVFSVYVLEHVEDAPGFSAEVARVLKPGGEFWSITPNRLHYVPIMASLTPTKFHKWVNEKRGRDSDDTFPTYYRLNAPSHFKQHFGGAGMEKIEVTSVEVRPNYLRFALPLFLLGAAYERIVNSTDLLSRIRVNFIAGFRKTEASNA
jgi:SAM-dependent methyltransferase